MSLLRSHNVGIQYGGNQILRDIDFSIDRGEIVTIVGPNGSGKSTFLRVLIGAQTPSEGRVERAPALRIGYVPQHPAFLDETVEECFKRVFTLKANQNKFYNREKILLWLEQLSLPDTGKNNSDKGDFTELLNRPARELSGGESQVVALFRALQLDPQVLLLDEPTASMDTELTRLMEDLLEKWHKCSSEIFPVGPDQQTQRAWIWVSHNPQQLSRMCGQTYSLDAVDGK